MSDKFLNVAFIGNPNCGKTTLFNAYTGANLKVANWPGVTVEKVEGSFRFQDYQMKLVDLPGTYSLTSYTMEEKVSREYILSDAVDVIIDVADASSLERNLYLTLQLIELGKPVVLALNMMDIVEKRGMEIDLHRLPEMLGIPVVPVSARKRRGLDILMHAAVHHKDHQEKTPVIHHHGNRQSQHPHDHHREFAMVYSDEVEDKIDVIKEQLKQKYPEMFNHRWHAIKILEGDEEVTKRYPVELPEGFVCNYEQQIINEKYDFIEEIMDEVMVHREQKAAATDRVDAILTNQWLGLPIFLVIMAGVFFLTFTIGDWLKEYMALFIEMISQRTVGALEALEVNQALTSLIVDGIISGVGDIPSLCFLLLQLCHFQKRASRFPRSIFPPVAGIRLNLLIQHIPIPIPSRFFDRCFFASGFHLFQTQIGVSCPVLRLDRLNDVVKIFLVFCSFLRRKHIFLVDQRRLKTVVSLIQSFILPGINVPFFSALQHIFVFRSLYLITVRLAAVQIFQFGPQILLRIGITTVTVTSGYFHQRRHTNDKNQKDSEHDVCAHLAENFNQFILYQLKQFVFPPLSVQ